MTSGESLLERLHGKELHFRLVVNNLLEDGKKSLTAVSRGATEEAVLGAATLRAQDYTEYSPQSILGALAATVAGRRACAAADPGAVVFVQERDGSVSADDHRYIEWLSETRGEIPRVILLPEAGRAHHEEGEAQPHHLLDAKEEARLRSFWRRQYRRLKALPAPITKDAALVAIPRTFIPVAFSVFLSYLKRSELPMGRAAAYVGLAFGFNIGFGLFSQTVFNWFTFWSEFSRDAFGPSVLGLEAWVSRQGARARGSIHSQGPLRRGTLTLVLGGAKLCTNALGFVSARGDVLIAAPLLGIGTMYLARLVLGPVGETVSVLTWGGFLLVLGNVVIGSLAGGPYPQVIAHLRAVGKITNKASLYLGIVETIKMELGRVADFGMQVLYNAIQGTLAVVFWALLLLVDRCYVKPVIEPLSRKQDIASVRRLFDELRGRGAGATSGEIGILGVP
jgi:hypothetical protein